MKEKKKSVEKGYYEMTVKDSFDAAHYLINYPGKCVNLHGHTWDVEVVVGGEKLNEIGLLYDFRSLKKILKELLNKFDHKYLNEIAPFDKESPTAENLARYLFKKLSESVPSEIKLVKVTVWESLEAKVTYSE
ncbi:MAG: 6-carboxytetrahydropterin synthase QueD [Actinomycetia bacterium]|nr:6-carboxytetrahydropterin synthase QueD [Actinomycetes bacterium]